MKSIGNKILLIFLFSVTFTMFFLGVIIITIDTYKIKSNLKQNIEHISNRLAETLAIPFWNLDSIQIEKIINFEFQDGNVMHVSLYDEDNNKTEYNFVREKNTIKQIENSEEKINVFFLSTQKEIIKDNIKIGKVEVIFSDNLFKKEIFNNTLKIIIQLVILLIIITIVSLIVFKRILVSPLNKMLEKIKDLAEGEGDLTKKIDIKVEGEIKNLSVYINNFIDKLAIMISKLISITEKSGAVGVSLATNAEELSATMNQFNATIQAMKNENTKLNESILNSNNSLKKIKEFLVFLKEEINKEATIINDSYDIINKAIIEI